jgi:hypothetical protein
VGGSIPLVATFRYSDDGDNMSTILTKDTVRRSSRLYAFLVDFATQYNAVLTKLDSDAGVTDTDYNSLHAISLGAHPADVKTEDPSEA